MKYGSVFIVRRWRYSPRRSVTGGGWIALCLAFACPVAVAVAAGCGANSEPAERHVLTVSVYQESAWLRNFNPLLAQGMTRWPARYGIYEPLLIFNPLRDGGTWTPWLATSFTWSADLLTLRFELRRDVRWSDGTPFTSRDVVSTFMLLKKHSATDLNGVWVFLDRVADDGRYAVVFHFTRPYSPGLADVAHQVIVPEHIWAKVDDPVTFTNPTPVGTGPFTEVGLFTSQVYEIGRNPRYWGGVSSIDAIRMPTYPSNDQSQLALIEGSLDWATTYIPAVKTTFEARAPEFYHHWFPTLGESVYLCPNTQRSPFNDPQVRRAISMAIDRERIVAIAMENYTTPDDGTGLSDAFASWKPAHVDRRWVTRDLAAADRLLTSAGLRVDGAGRRRGVDGKPLEMTIQVVSGWSDWIRASQLIARDLRAIGITARVRVYEFATWFSNMQRSEFDLAIAWSLHGTAPDRTYRWLMSSSTLRPRGEASQGNWNHVGDPLADALFDQFDRTHDSGQQKLIAEKLQQRFAEIAPVIPLFSAPLWGAFSTRRITGFPSADDPYARLGPVLEPDRLLVLTRLRAKEH
jgi:peptide/nickel transport system substrate-binding protein